MRSIKRNRQIEDLVFDKLQKRGFIENGEENANFVKNLQLGVFKSHEKIITSIFTKFLRFFKLKKFRRKYRKNVRKGCKKTHTFVAITGGRIQH